MVLDVLKERFREAKYDLWQGYALLDLPDGEDPRDDCFKKMDETVDIIPATLRESTEQFLAFNAARFDIILKNLCEDVGWDFFPEDATVFVEMLIGRLRESSPETCQRWRIEPEADKLNFCDPPNT
jgi:hypothetical protein